MSGVDPQKLFAVQVLRNLSFRGGHASVHQLATNRRMRRQVRAALQLAAREQLVTSTNGELYTLTEKAMAALAAGLDAGERLEREAAA